MCLSTHKQMTQSPDWTEHFLCKKYQTNHLHMRYKDQNEETEGKKTAAYKELIGWVTLRE